MTVETATSNMHSGPSGQARIEAVIAGAAAVWRWVLFGAMAALSIYFTVAHVRNPAVNPWYVSPLYVAGALVAWFNPVAAVFGFVVAIPLVHGATQVWAEPAGNPWNVAFSGIFLAWFVRRVFFRRTGIDPPTRTAVLVDVLSTSALCSLLAMLVGYPRAEVVPAIFREITLNQYVLLYCVQAAAVFTQGLFLYRILGLEAGSIGGHRPFARVLLLVAAVVIGFSLLQFVFDMPVWRGLIGKGRRGLFSPFDDIHSYGSAIVLLFSMALFMAIGERGRIRILSGVATVLLAGCGVFSISRTTWVALAAVVMVSVWQLRRKYAIAVTAAVLLSVALTVSVMQARNIRIPFVPISTQELTSPAMISMRAFQWSIAGAMIRDAPLSGVGIGSFLRLFPYYSDYDPVVDGAGPYGVRIPANAHNYYLQLAAELGIPVLVVFLLMVVYAGRAALGRLKTEPEARPLVMGLIVGVGGYLLTAVSGHPLLLPAQQFVFWFAMAALTIVPGRSADPGAQGLGWVPLAVVALLSLAMVVGNVSRATTLPASPGYTYGLYAPDTWGDEAIQWTGKDARILVRARSDLIAFRVITHRHNVRPKGLDLNVWVNGMEIDRRIIDTPGAHQFAYYVPGIEGQTIPVQLSVGRTFNPQRLGLNQDYRDLGVALASITFPPFVPPGGVGFYPWESTDERVRFRWTERQATIPLRGRSPESALTLLLSARHPDIGTTPVSLDILADGRILQTVVLTDVAWKQVEIPAGVIRGARGLTLRVDRTWNPNRAGVSEDPRDLGVAVIIR